MANPEKKSSTEISEDIREEVETALKEGIEILNLKELVSEIEDFDKKHKKQKEKLKNGTRRRTSGRIL